MSERRVSSNNEFIFLQQQLIDQGTKLDTLIESVTNHIGVCEVRDKKIEDLVNAWNILVNTKIFLKFTIPIIIGGYGFWIWIQNHLHNIKSALF